MDDLISKSSVFELIERKCVDGCLEVGGRTLIDAYELIDDVSDLPIVTVDKLMEVYDKEVRDKTIREFAKAINNKISEFVLQHKDNLDFASGISVVWNIVDEIVEQMKEVGE